MEPAAITVEKLGPPLPPGEILAFLAHKGSPWLEDIRRRAEGQYADSADRFFLARANRELVGHVWYAAAAGDPRLGLLGHVYTRPDHRRRGIARRLVQAAMSEFLAGGGQVMQLFTDTTAALRFYEQLGFESLYAKRVLHEMDWAMRHPAGSPTTVNAWFRRAPVRIRSLAAGDWYTHPAFAEAGRQLVDACLACRGDLGVEIVYALAADEGKSRALAALGFAEKGLLPRHYKLEAERMDCRLFQADHLASQ